MKEWFVLVAQNEVNAINNCKTMNKIEKYFFFCFFKRRPTAKMRFEEVNHLCKDYSHILIIYKTNNFIYRENRQFRCANKKKSSQLSDLLMKCKIL